MLPTGSARNRGQCQPPGDPGPDAPAPNDKELDEQLSSSPYSVMWNGYSSSVEYDVYLQGISDSNFELEFQIFSDLKYQKDRIYLTGKLKRGEIQKITPPKFQVADEAKKHSK